MVHESSAFANVLDTKSKKDVPFMTLSNLITALLNDLQKIYIIGDAPIDVKMKKRIVRVQEIVNSYDQVSNLIVKKPAVSGSRN